MQSVSFNNEDVVSTMEDSTLTEHMRSRREGIQYQDNSTDPRSEVKKLNEMMTKISAQFDFTSDNITDIIERHVQIIRQLIDPDLVKMRDKNLIKESDTLLSDFSEFKNLFNNFRRETMITLGKFSNTYKPPTPPPVTTYSFPDIKLALENAKAEANDDSDSDDEKYLRKRNTNKSMGRNLEAFLKKEMGKNEDDNLLSDDSYDIESGFDRIHTTSDNEM